MSANQRILIAILLFVTFTVGSFVWFVATWDASNEEPVTQNSGVMNA